MRTALIALLLAFVLTASCACACGVANPWRETDADGVFHLVGARFGVPEGAEDLAWYALETEDLAEFQFVWYGMEYNARMKRTDGFEDISGMYFEWGGDEACLVNGCEGVTRRAYDEGNTADLCLWYDAEAGVMYSVSTIGKDLDGFDILACAGQLYLPARGD